MSLHISSYLSSISGTSNGINKNSAQYKAVVKNSLSGIIANEATMSDTERLVYEMFGGRDTIIKNKMKMYDSNGNLLNADGVAGMDMTGKSLSEKQQIIDVSDEYRQKMFDLVKKEYIRENGVANGDTTNRSSVYTEYQKSVKIDDRLKGSWTLQQYENAYRKACYNAVKAANPDWKIGQSFDASILDSVTRESVEANLVKSGNTFVTKSVDYSV
ncbi:MAG: DUF3879 family protein [Lachnospiraceae bacterium]|nr:DUF3879 family protein [Lachnospiraceae bacterium]